VWCGGFLPLSLPFALKDYYSGNRAQTACFEALFPALTPLSRAHTGGEEGGGGVRSDFAECLLQSHNLWGTGEEE